MARDIGRARGYCPLNVGDNNIKPKRIMREEIAEGFLWGQRSWLVVPYLSYVKLIVKSRFSVLFRTSLNASHAVKPDHVGPI